MTIFSKIIKKEIPANIAYEDGLCLAFHDINPQAPVHLLIIPKTTEIDRLSSAGENHKELLGHLLLTASKIAKDHNLTDYRLVINNGENAGQTVFHLHLHLMAGRPFDWPAG